MGFDISFHPVDPKQLQTFVFDIYSDPSLAETRISYISANSDDQDFLRTHIYGVLPRFRQQLEAGSGFDDSIAFLTAAIAGYLHPYWYSRGGCLSFLVEKIPELSSILCSVSTINPEPFANVTEKGSGRILANYTGGGYVMPNRIEELKTILSSRKYARIRNQILGKSNWVSLQNALSYCLTHKLGLMEASDIFVPLSGKTPSNPENFRAAHLKNLKDMRNARRVLLTPSSAEECTTEVNQYKLEIANALFNVQLDSIWLAQLDSSTLEFLAANCAKSKEKLAKSPNTPTPILVQLARDKSNKASGHFLAHLVLNNAATPSSLLEELAATGSKGMCIEIAYHTNASPQLLRKLLDNSRGMPGIRLGIAKNPNTPFDILERLANDSLQQAREAAKSHPTFRQNKKQQG